jgi:hypothetical protein
MNLPEISIVISHRGHIAITSLFSAKEKSSEFDEGQSLVIYVVDRSSSEYNEVQFY